MLKPLKKSIDKKMKPLKAKEVTKAKEPSQLIVSLKDGNEVYCDANTGEIVEMHSSFTPVYELFNSEKASILVSSLSQGIPLNESLHLSHISKATFSAWLISNEDFNQAVEKAREVRAHHAHEQLYSLVHKELLSEIPEEDEDINLHMKKMAVIERRQKILGKFKQEDNPNRFGVKDNQNGLAASVAISIDPDIVTKMQANFKSSLNSDGELDTSSSIKALNDILDVDYNEIKDE